MIIRLTALQKELGGPETASDAFNRVQGEIDAAVRDRAARTAALGSFVYAQKDPQVISLNEQIKLLEKIRGLEAARAAASGMPGAGGATSSPRASAIADDTPNDNFRKQIESIKRARAARDEMIGMALVSGSSADGGLEGKPLRAVTSFYDEATQAAMLSTERQKAMWQDLGYTVRSTAGVMATDMQTLGKGAFSSLVGSAQTYFVALASGEKHAAEIASAAFLSSTGDKLVGFGTEATFKGAGYLIDSAGLDPRGYAMLGLGAAAIGAGIGMGAAAGAVTASIPKDAGKAPKIGTAGGSRGGGGIGGGSSGEGVRYVFNYGIAGPQPDETAREVARQLRRGHSRGFADTSISRGR